MDWEMGDIVNHNFSTTETKEYKKNLAKEFKRKFHF